MSIGLIGATCEHTVHSALEGILQRAGQRGEYENFLIPQTPSDVISTYPLASQQGVSGGDEDTSQHYVPATQLRSLS
jgi:hypothetical protein